MSDQIGVEWCRLDKHEVAVCFRVLRDDGGSSYISFSQRRSIVEVCGDMDTFRTDGAANSLLKELGVTVKPAMPIDAEVNPIIGSSFRGLLRYPDDEVCFDLCNTTLYALFKHRDDYRKAVREKAFDICLDISVDNLRAVIAARRAS